MSSSSERGRLRADLGVTKAWSGSGASGGVPASIGEPGWEVCEGSSSPSRFASGSVFAPLGRGRGLTFGVTGALSSPVLSSTSPSTLGFERVTRRGLGRGAGGTIPSSFVWSPSVSSPLEAAPLFFLVLRTLDTCAT